MTVKMKEKGRFQRRGSGSCLAQDTILMRKSRQESAVILLISQPLMITLTDLGSHFCDIAIIIYQTFQGTAHIDGIRKVALGRLGTVKKDWWHELIRKV